MAGDFPVLLQWLQPDSRVTLGETGCFQELTTLPACEQGDHFDQATGAQRMAKPGFKGADRDALSYKLTQG